MLRKIRMPTYAVLDVEREIVVRVTSLGMNFEMPSDFSAAVC